MTFSLNDDSMLLWLSDRSRAATAFAKSWLLTHPVTGHDIKGAPRVLSGSGLSRVFAGQGAADFYGVSLNEARHPDFVGVVQHGVVYTGGTKKIAEHGGMDVQDRNVPIVVAGGRDGRRGHTVATPVETTQIAPTILSALGLDPRSLKAVRLEGTRVLPGQRG